MVSQDIRYSFRYVGRLAGKGGTSALIKATVDGACWQVTREVLRIAPGGLFEIDCVGAPQAGPMELCFSLASVWTGAPLIVVQKVMLEAARQHCIQHLPVVPSDGTASIEERRWYKEFGPAFRAWLEAQGA